ncbi:hypothetical protein GCM10010172_40760 [Paractinoplanes ferrugineus]|uniref:Uncharacterized protein n=1 Tax=Paractinoplanes ferrugineus TaxID=113564 RepID=A0A919MEX3_9ACTN|nr:hypothetical protein [Actinoplanes ferrugineus]GIE12154.1 hypothetical protein Afe05nite_39940 [Actinoplanes ferrugineus]
METAMHSFLVSVPQAAALWAVMLGAVLLATVVIARMQRRRPAAGPADRRSADDAEVAAERAAAAAARLRAEWDSAQERLDAAWAAFDAADKLARQAAKACAYPLISKRRKPGENAHRERYLHHAAGAACRNQEISIAQLNDIYAHRGWNPRLHPVMQESMLRQAVRAHRFDGYQKALKIERTAWQEAEAAAESLRALRLEAGAVSHAAATQPAADEQWWAEQWTTAELPAAA